MKFLSEKVHNFRKQIFFALKEVSVAYEWKVQRFLFYKNLIVMNGWIVLLLIFQKDIFFVAAYCSQMQCILELHQDYHKYDFSRH